MIELGDQPVEVPPLVVGPQVPEGRVYVFDGAEGQLSDGVRAVLETEGGVRELTTAAQAGGIVNVPGTYLNEADYGPLMGSLDEPHLRLYGRGDLWRKARSRKGWVLFLTTVLGVLLAGFGAVLVLWGESPTSAAAVAERSQALVRWVAEPAGSAAAVGAQVARREARAQQCLTRLRGGEGNVEKVAGVACQTDSPPFLLNKENKALLAALIGLATTILGAIGIVDKFRFGRQPS